MSKRSFLFEIGLEEMPARFVTDAANQLTKKVETWLSENRLKYHDIHTYATPRRLAVLVAELHEKQGDIEEEAKGPSKKIAQDENGEWTKAAQGFARGQGVAVNDLYFKELKGEEYVFVKKFIAGRSTSELLPEMKEVMLSISFPKNMRWGANALKYVRPIKWITALYGEEIIPFEVEGVVTSNTTLGHRFLGEGTTLPKADEYVQTLLAQHVIASEQERKSAIRNQVEGIGESEGWDILIDEELLDEVTNLVEYPTALYGEFDERFLNIPDDVLITSMKEHQRYFPVRNKDGELLPYFITVRNGDHRHLENVQKGNEKVLRARLADAEFFYEEDLKKPLDDRLKRLESIVYHEELGSMGDKVRRIKELSMSIAKTVGIESNRLNKVERVAELCKADLVTHMVDEFPELEGRMGEEYALKFGEDVDVAKAIYEHYLPKQATDFPPSTQLGSLVSVADKVDTIVSSFGIGMIPSGSQDPHGLRRQTAGIIQVYLSQGWDFDLIDVFEEALKLAESRGLLKRDVQSVKDDLIDFLKLRLKNLLQDEEVRYDVVEAVLKTDIGHVNTLVKKAHFLMAQIEKAEFKKLVEAFSRVTNISKKAQESSAKVKEELLNEPEEQKLKEAKDEIEPIVGKYLLKGKIEDAYKQLVTLEPVIHDYFDNIMVMTDDESLKKNRLAQMTETSRLINTFADFNAIVFHSE
ncbi:glycine--tRNA ligase subunit beta [Bacillus shivajii]|uniref:glycine--tRNA ligase subunit beta n=1 Tax=Bacillus shivajii TaxID=1983719 RepID=UPI001CFB7C25|nr:glycine--tRNA ligase subunit beta [Bacillus shivajii]UCZ54509.1 glycine--tRNA ligase subunit beta [Bacillus shivajii]